MTTIQELREIRDSITNILCKQYGEDFQSVPDCLSNVVVHIDYVGHYLSTNIGAEKDKNLNTALTLLADNINECKAPGYFFSNDAWFTNEVTPLLSKLSTLLSSIDVIKPDRKNSSTSPETDSGSETTGTPASILFSGDNNTAPSSSPKYKNT